MRYVIRPTGESSVSIELVRRGLRSRKHVLFFQQYQGEVEYDPEDLEQARATILVDVDSMVCRDASLTPSQRQEATGALKELLGAEDFPQLAFHSKAVQGVSRHRAEVTGLFTARGVASPASLQATVVPIGKDQLELDLTGTLRLSSYAIKPPSTWWGQPSLKDEAQLRMLLWPGRAVA
jgi:polyisoprenoid-binding protein YceI